MDAFKTNLQSIEIGLQSLQQIQTQYDEVGWVLSDPPFEKFRHIAIHLAMISGEMMKHCEAWEHAVVNNNRDTSVVDVKTQKESVQAAIGNYLFHSAQLANLIETEAFKCLTDLYEANAKRFAPNSPFASITEPKD